jgi:hypothetical protein
MIWWVPAVWVGLQALSVVVHISNHGKSSGEYSGPTRFVGACFMAWLFWYGGFFNVWSAP